MQRSRRWKWPRVTRVCLCCTKFRQAEPLLSRSSFRGKVAINHAGLGAASELVLIKINGNNYETMFLRSAPCLLGCCGSALVSVADISTLHDLRPVPARGSVF